MSWRRASDDAARLIEPLPAHRAALAAIEALAGPYSEAEQMVEVVQHSNASITAVKRHGHWLIQSFVGGAGAI
jgi:hypothetical protein